MFPSLLSTNAFFYCFYILVNGESVNIIFTSSIIEVSILFNSYAVLLYYKTMILHIKLHSFLIIYCKKVSQGFNSFFVRVTKRYLYILPLKFISTEDVKYNELSRVSKYKLAAIDSRTGFVA